MKWMIYTVENGWLLTSETNTILHGSDIARCRVFETMTHLAEYLKYVAGESQPRDSKGRFVKCITAVRA